MKYVIADIHGIHDYANGIDPSPVLAEPEEAKGYSISTTLEDDVKRADQAYPVLLALADSKVLDDLHIMNIIIKQLSFHICQILRQTDLMLLP